MKKYQNFEVKKMATVAILTALTVVLSLIKIPIVGASVTLVLPVVVIGAALYGPIVGAWLTVIPNLLAFSEAGIFMTYSPAGCVATLLLKGILAGACAGLVYKFLSNKRPLVAVTCAAVVAPVLNSGIFALGCYLFIWDELINIAGEKGIGIGMLVFGLVGLNFIIELIFNVVLCPTILRIIQIAPKFVSKKNADKK